MTCFYLILSSHNTSTTFYLYLNLRSSGYDSIICAIRLLFGKLVFTSFGNLVSLYSHTSKLSCTRCIFLRSNWKTKFIWQITISMFIADLTYILGAQMNVALHELSFFHRGWYLITPWFNWALKFSSFENSDYI